MRKIILQGILFDEKSSYIRGPAKAPPLIREAFYSDSANYYSELGLEIRPELFEDKGDYKISEYFDIEDITIQNLNKNSSIITLGGDHSITYPLLKAFHQIHGPVEMLHIDAHSDLYESFEGDRYSHACPFARILEDGLVSQLHQMGIRTLNTHQREQAKKYGVNIIEMKEHHKIEIPNFQKPIYLSLDIDALDPAFAPGVSHQEPGGYSSRELISIIQHLNVPILGADIVEYNPDRDINKMTAMLCAKLLKEIAAKCLLEK